MTPIDLFPADFRLERRTANGVTLNVRYDGRRAPHAPLSCCCTGFRKRTRSGMASSSGCVSSFTLVYRICAATATRTSPMGRPITRRTANARWRSTCSTLMRGLGLEQFFVCGHDRGGRVAHRLALDHPQAVRALLLLDISPTLTMYERTTMEFARAYYHWFFLIQPAPLPETLIGAAPSFYLRTKLGGWGSRRLDVRSTRARSPSTSAASPIPGAIHAMCEDYRAAATIDLAHDRADAARRIDMPASRVLWGERGVVHRLFTPLADWQAKCAPEVTGRATADGTLHTRGSARPAGRRHGGVLCRALRRIAGPRHQGLV